MLRTGVDLVEVHRIKTSLEKSDRFLKRVYTEREIADCHGKMTSLAARWAAKEAVSKAFGTGIGDVGFQDIEVRKDERDAPYLHLTGNAAQLAEELGLTEWSISLSHTETYAVAFVVALGK